MLTIMFEFWASMRRSFFSRVGLYTIAHFLFYEYSTGANMATISYLAFEFATGGLEAESVLLARVSMDVRHIETAYFGFLSCSFWIETKIDEMSSR